MAAVWETVVWKDAEFPSISKFLSMTHVTRNYWVTVPAWGSKDTKKNGEQCLLLWYPQSSEPDKPTNSYRRNSGHCLPLSQVARTMEVVLQWEKHADSLPEHTECLQPAHTSLPHHVLLLPPAFDWTPLILIALKQRSLCIDSVLWGVGAWVILAEVPELWLDNFNDTYRMFMNFSLWYKKIIKM